MTKTNTENWVDYKGLIFVGRESCSLLPPLTTTNFTYMGKALLIVGEREYVRVLCMTTWKGLGESPAAAMIQVMQS